VRVEDVLDERWEEGGGGRVIYAVGDTKGQARRRKQGSTACIAALCEVIGTEKVTCRFETARRDA
jgi:hypothetical protein